MGRRTSSRCTSPRRPRPRTGSTRTPSRRCATGGGSSTSRVGRSSTRGAPERRLNVARGRLIDEEALEQALDSGKVGGAALDVFRSEPITEHPLFGRPNVVVTPHLGASTAEATDRAGYQAAEQIVAALTGGAVTTAVNAPAIKPEDLEVLGPFLP